MTDVFIIRNQHGHYWGKGKAWVDGSDPRALVRYRHEDEAVNTLFELSSKDIELRGEVQSVALSARGEPEVEKSAVPLPTDGPVDEAENASQDNPVHSDASAGAGP